MEWTSVVIWCFFLFLLLIQPRRVFVLARPVAVRMCDSTLKCDVNSSSHHTHKSTALLTCCVDFVWEEHTSHSAKATGLWRPFVSGHGVAAPQLLWSFIASQPTLTLETLLLPSPKCCSSSLHHAGRLLLCLSLLVDFCETNPNFLNICSREVCVSPKVLGVAQLEECLPGVHKALGQFLKQQNLGLVAAPVLHQHLRAGRR